MRYIEPMYEVLVFVYEHFWGGQACPDRAQLGRRLSAAGFERDDIQQALAWLDGLRSAGTAGTRIDPDTHAAANDPAMDSALDTARAPNPRSLRVYLPAELTHLGAEGIRLLHFLEHAGALPAALREVVIERALAVPGPPLSPQDLKVIVLMVYWHFGVEPDLLVQDELCDDASQRLAH